MQNEKAFTLAEVLITLGVIGVVAAMTMPSLVADYKKKATVSQLKKIYSTLNQAMKRSEVDNGDYESWDLGNTIGAKAYFEKYWHPYLNVIKICVTSSECGYGNSNTFWKRMNNQNDDHFFSDNGVSRVPMILSDGTFISIKTATGYFTNASQILVDLNGSKPPNKFGKDVFWFIREQKKGFMPYGYEEDEQTVNNECSRTGVGKYCAAKIMRDNWEIGKDYAW